MTSGRGARAGIVDTVLRDWRRIVLIVLITSVVVWMLGAAQPPRYRASTLAAVAPRSGTLEPGDFLRSLEVLERNTVVMTVAALATTRSMHTRVGASSAVDIDSEVVPETNLFRITVEGGNASRTAAIANRVRELLSVETRAMYRYYEVTAVTPATIPDDPFQTRSKLALAAGPVLGLGLGIASALLRRWRAHRGATGP